MCPACSVADEVEDRGSLGIETTGGKKNCFQLPIFSTIFLRRSKDGGSLGRGGAAQVEAAGHLGSGHLQRSGCVTWMIMILTVPRCSKYVL